VARRDAADGPEMPLAMHEFETAVLDPHAGPALSESEGAPSCPTCAHPMDAHDAIALRFCRATASQSLSRGCVCPQPVSAVHL
jgi:hypothetical protein